MGRFSTTVHIKNSIDRMRFVNSFCDMMKKRGFVPCSEDEAVLSYLLTFGEGGWVTLANEEYKDNPQKAYDDSREIAVALKTSAFSVEVVDSDFALLKLSNPNGGKDEVIVGDGSGYGVEEPMRGKRQYWEKLLVEGKTWEQFSETAVKNEVFVENALAELAGVLGIEPYYICADFDEVSDKADSDSVAAYYFKKAAAKAKTMSLNAAFKQVFGEALEPLGFKLIKSKYPYFVRVVNDEIIHVISYYNDKRGYDRDHDYIVIKGGVATVYRPEIDLTQNPKRENWLISNCGVYLHRLELNLQQPDDELKHQFYYHSSLPDENLKEMEYQLALTKQFIISALDKAISINSCIEHYFETGMSLTLYDDGSFGAAYGNSYYNEGMLYFKTDRSVYENRTRNAVDEAVLRSKAYFEKVHNDPDLYNEVQAELERRKAANTEILKSYGLSL